MSSALATSALEVAVAGGPLAVFRFGTSGAGDAQVLAVHGITANSRAWVPVARALDGVASVIAPDLRGRGRSSELPAPYGIDAHVADLIALLDQLPIQQPAVVVGHSLGAYIVAALVVRAPERVRAAILVDGGLKLPLPDGVDPQALLDATLGPAVARLRMTFPSRAAYRDWWRSHPAFARGDVADEDLTAYADHDLVGGEPELRSSVAEPAVRGDAAALFDTDEAAARLAVASTLLIAPRGLLDDPHPLQPAPLAHAWAGAAPELRRVVEVPDVNHYTLTLGRAGAAAVARAVADALAG